MVDDQNRPDDMGSFIEEDDFLAAERDEAEGFGDGGDFDKPAQKPNLKEIWEQNPSLKIFAAVAGVAVFLIAFMVFGSDDTGGDDDQNSIVRQGGEVTQAPGTQELSPAYEEAVRTASQQRAEQAAATGGSAIPTPIARPSERIEAPIQVEEDDPLAAWRREAEARRAERQKQSNTTASILPAAKTLPPSMPAINNGGVAGSLKTTPTEPQNPPLPMVPAPDVINSMAQQLQQQMQTVMETQVPKESVLVSMNIQPAYDIKKYFPPEEDPVAQKAAAQAANNAYNNAQRPKPIVQAGTIAYAQILTEANSDVPGPVLAEIASGPFQGGRAIGQFQVAQRHLVLQFNRVVKDGIEYPTQAYALDPGTTLPGVATEVNRHYFSRVFLPAAARFIEGYAEAATRRDNQVVVVDGTVISNNNNDLDTKQEIMEGVNEAGQQLSQVLEQDFGNRPITVRVAAGTRIGLLFVSSVFDPNALQPGQQMNQQLYGQGGGYAQGNTNNGLVGQAYNAYNNYNQSNNGYNNQSYNAQQYNAQQQQSYMNTRR